MNAERRKKLASLLATIQRINRELQSEGATLDDVKDEEQSAFDNMPEGLQQGEKGDLAQQAIDALDEAKSYLDDAVGALDSLESSIDTATAE